MKINWYIRTKLWNFMATLLFFGFIIVSLITLNFFWSNFPQLPPLSKKVITSQNEGQVCFERSSNPQELVGYVKSPCMGCAHGITGSSNQTIDPAQKKIIFQSEFTMIAENFHLLCDQDCGAKGTVNFNAGVVDKGLYTTWLGTTQIGMFYVPLEDKLTCFPPNPDIRQIYFNAYYPPPTHEPTSSVPTRAYP